MAVIFVPSRLSVFMLTKMFSAFVNALYCSPFATYYILRNQPMGVYLNHFVYVFRCLCACLSVAGIVQKISSESLNLS